MIIGITGIFGSGKTEIACIFAGYGYKLINVDNVGHILLDKKEIKNKIVKEFGNVLTNKKVDRRKLKDIVFNDPKELKKLDRIIHPYLVKEVKKLIKKYKKAVVDAALLIELGMYKYVDKIVVVKINKNKAIKRITENKKYTKKEIENVIKSQLSQNKKLKYADFIVDNNKSVNNTRKQITGICKKLP
jgi:dephospho-CoA kinase